MSENRMQINFKLSIAFELHHTTGHFSFVETQTKATALWVVSSLPTLAKMSSSMELHLIPD